jgi:hypothetical protein
MQGRLHSETESPETLEPRRKEKRQEEEQDVVVFPLFTISSLALIMLLPLSQTPPAAAAAAILADAITVRRHPASAYSNLLRIACPHETLELNPRVSFTILLLALPSKARGNIVVCRFIIKYSSLRDFGPPLSNNNTRSIYFYMRLLEDFWKIIQFLHGEIFEFP